MNRNYSAVCLLALTLLLSGLSVASYGASSKTDKNENAPNIENITEKLHFLSIGDSYTDDKNILVCVETQPEQYALWNPITDSISQASKKRGCEVEPQYRAMRSIVAPEHDTVMIDAGFSGASKISLVFDNITKGCSSDFRTYYNIKYQNGISDGFYVLVKLVNPIKSTRKGWCDGAPNGEDQTISKQFDTVSGLLSIDLKNGKTLVYSLDNRTVEPVILRISSLPATVWSSAGNVFLVPKLILYPELKKSDHDLAKRYDALLAAIK